MATGNKIFGGVIFWLRKLNRARIQLQQTLPVIRDRILIPWRGLYLRELLPQAKFSRAEDLYKRAEVKAGGGVGTDDGTDGEVGTDDGTEGGTDGGAGGGTDGEIGGGTAGETGGGTDDGTEGGTDGGTAGEVGGGTDGEIGGGTGSDGELLILLPCRNVARFVPGLRKNLLGLSYPKQLISIGFLESSSSDGTYEALQEAKRELEREFKKVWLLRKDFGGGSGSDKKRWDVRKQRERRARLARTRNHLLGQCLKDEHKWVLWIDADVIKWDADCIEKLMAFGKDLIVPRCVREDNSKTYDLNSFKYSDAKKQNWKSHIVDGLIQPMSDVGRLSMDDLAEYELVSLDGIGGTMVLVRADLHRRGLVYPEEPYHMHIETEAMAFMARDMGSEAWAAPKVTIVHPIYD